MAGLIDVLRTGSWLTRERMRLVALAVIIASLAGAAYLAATATGLSDYQGRPFGTDFSNIYAAGRHVLDGRPDAPFDPALQHAGEQAIFGADTPFYGWHYPPFFLFIAAALALMPYLPALAVWQGATLVLYLLTIHAILRRIHTETDAERLWLLLTFAFPAVFINIGHGHNGFLTATLIGFALLHLDRKPAIAGILFGFLAYKPQFGVMIPLILIATGRWRAFAAATATVAALTLATTLIFGPRVWEAFFASTHFTRTVVLESGGTGWHKIQSVFSWVRTWGGPVPLAYAIQGATTLALAFALIWLWRSRAAFALKAAALPIASILATPYSLDYDMMALALTIAFLAADGMTRGFGPYEKSALAGLWFMPLIARTIAQQTMIPLGVIVMLAVLILILCRSARGIGGGHESLRAAPQC